MKQQTVEDAHCCNCGISIYYKHEVCQHCGYEKFLPVQGIAVSVTPNLLDVMEKMESQGYKLRKSNGKPEIVRGVDIQRVKFSVFAGLRRRGLIEELPSGEYFSLTYKAEAVASGKWPYFSIRIPQEFRVHKERKA